MTAFETTWAAVEALHLKDPLKELGIFLRGQPGTGVDKSNFSDNPSAMQLATLYNTIKEADPDTSDAKTAGSYDRKDFEFWRDNKDFLDKCAAAMRAKAGGLVAQVDEKKTAAMQTATVLQSSDRAQRTSWKYGQTCQIQS